MKTRRKSWNRPVIVVVVSILFGLTSCLDKKYDFNNISNEVEITPGFAAPLAYGTLTLDNILKKLDSTGFVNQYDDSLLYIIYSKNLISLKASEFITIPDQDFAQFSVGPDIPVAFVIPGAPSIDSTINIPGYGEIPLSYDQDLEYIFDNGGKINSLNLWSATMEINVASTFQDNLVVVLSSESIKVNGLEWRKEINISNSQGTFNEELSNIGISLDNTSNPLSTLIHVKIGLKIFNTGQTIRPGDKCDISMSFKNNKFASLFGYIGAYDLLDYSDTVDVSLFNMRIQGGSLSFFNPQLSLKVKNSFGIPFQIDLSEVKAVSTINNKTTDVIFYENPFDINYPATIGDFAEDSIQINKSTSNIDSALNSSPNHMNFRATARTIKTGVSNTNFVTDNSTIDLGVQVILPIEVKAEGFELEDTVAIDFEKNLGSELDMIKNFRVTFFADNRFPIETKLQVYFTDSTYTFPALDSLFSNGPMFLPALDSTTTIISFENLENLHQARFAFIRARINTPATGYSKFFSYNGIHFHLSAKSDFIINSNDL
jgi:hypothetical protein